MKIRKLSAGDIIEARCTKCRAVMNHRIIAMVEERIVRVECNTCNGAHNYHEPAKPKETKAKATTSGASGVKTPAVSRSTKKDPKGAEREEWLVLQSTMAPEKAIAYDMERKYRTNDLVEHNVFGIGVVKMVINPNKMEVLFQEGKKLLRCL